MPISDRIRAELIKLHQEINEEHPSGRDIFADMEFNDPGEVTMLLFAAAALKGNCSLYFTREDGELEAITAHARKDQEGKLLTVLVIDSPDNIPSPELVDLAVELGMNQHQKELDDLINE